MYTLFELDEHYPISLHEVTNISKAEYMEWKVNWPQTADDCGKFEPRKKWRKDNPQDT